MGIMITHLNYLYSEARLKGLEFSGTINYYDEMLSGLWYQIGVGGGRPTVYSGETSAQINLISMHSNIGWRFTWHSTMSIGTTVGIRYLLGENAVDVPLPKLIPALTVDLGLIF